MIVENLLWLEERDRLPELLLFSGPRLSRSRRVGKGCLSQWYPAPFTVDGVRYPTAQHYLMAGKARLFGDAEAERLILATDDPGKAKRIGRKVRGFVNVTWAEHRYDLAVTGNRAKFGKKFAMHDFLLGTGHCVLVETNPYDSIWGIGLSASQPEAQRPSQWRGLNLLGFALMDVRDSLRDAQLREARLLREARSRADVFHDTE